jgi:hypothetical protein
LNIVVENGRDLVNGDSRIMVGTGTQRTSLEQNNRSFGELNVEPIGTLNKHGIYDRYIYYIFPF